jgi:hypothetical protein
VLIVSSVSPKFVQLVQEAARLWAALRMALDFIAPFYRRAA